MNLGDTAIAIPDLKLPVQPSLYLLVMVAVFLGAWQLVRGGLRSAGWSVAIVAFCFVAAFLIWATQDGSFNLVGMLNGTVGRAIPIALAALCGVKHALATTSGSASLIASLLALGLAPGDEVIVPAYTFVASYSSLIFCGGVPVLAEIDESLNLDPRDVEGRITPRTKALMPVHMLGNPCDMDPILDVARRRGLLVIEDACQAGGGSFRGRRLGTLGQIGAFSLNIFKTITAGDGGAGVTVDTGRYKRAFAIHDQGHRPNPKHVRGLVSI